MKKLTLLFALFISVFLTCRGQFEVKIGNDTTFCSNCIDNLTIAPNLSITGGIAPYSYTWTAKITPEENSEYYLGASDYLNDTTLANPSFIMYWKNGIWNKFFLTVRDSHGNTAQDSIRIRFSGFYGFPLSVIPLFISMGDSILLSLPDLGGIKPYQSYKWLPSEYLSNPDSSVTWAKPEKEMHYVCYIVDSVGCKGSLANPIWIIVDPVSISSPQIELDVFQKGEYLYFPNENQDKMILSFFDLSGSLLVQEITYSGKYKPMSDKLPRISLCVIDNGKEKKTIKYMNYE
ncbi:hypothetical protein LJB92_00380 [Bacteroidales bacterium OttesenSCG-928-M06]|nr:hypothetical protein [Bacteroidales bacterium OttesenSCG-928-M06]